MALVRHWYPSPNKSSRSGTPRLLVIHTTEGFTGPNGMYDCAIYFQGPVGASSHVIIDNYHPGHICEGVSPSYASWTQCNYNGATASSVEQCGYAAWTRSEWLNEKEPLLRNVAAWLAEESARWNIPLTDLTESQAQGSGRGVCYHMDLGSAGCGHSDPGSGYPLDVVLGWARDIMEGVPIGGTPEEPEEDEDEMPYLQVPSKRDFAKPITMSLNGFHSTIGLGVDVTGLDGVNVRVAGHIGSNQWRSANIYADEGHQKVVYSFKDGNVIKKFDILRVDRVDDGDFAVVLNIGK